jgi:hypothetical protein
LAQRVIDRFRGDFLNAEGLVSRTFPPSERTILDNLDDIAPFMAWWGAGDLLKAQVAKLTPDDFERRLPQGNLLYAYKIDEYLGGLNVVWKGTGDPHARRLLTDAVEKSWAYFGDPDLGLAEFYDFDARARSPFFSPWAAGLLETFLELDDNDDAMAQRVDAVLDLWWQHPYVAATGLLPFRGTFDPLQRRAEDFWARRGRWAGEAPIRSVGRRGSHARDVLRGSRAVNGVRRLLWRWGASGLWSQLMKSNTTPVFLAIALYARTKDETWRRRIRRWFEAVNHQLVRAEGVHGAVANGTPLGEPTLVAGFITIDAACDAWWHVERDDWLLDLAQSIALRCLQWKWENGLIPMTPSADRDHLDGQIDFAIALRRLAELTGKEFYRAASVGLLQAALARHDTPAGYCTHVRRNGSIVELPQNTIDPKYNGLVLKGLVSLATLDERIYGSPHLADLFKDR